MFLTGQVNTTTRSALLSGCSRGVVVAGQGGKADQVMVQAVQQQPEELLSIVLAAITEVGSHGQLGNAAQELRWVDSLLIALHIHLHSHQPITHTIPQLNHGNLHSQQSPHTNPRLNH